MDLRQHKNLLKSTGIIIAHQKEKEILRGEKFNVFSILNMEKKENRTHSAFLAELMNPVGTHLRGSVFLKLFLECICCQEFDISNARVKTEHHVGPVDIINKTGGRIDILISNKYGDHISIENKIDATDQDAQIERYCNYQKGKNRVFYLNLEGKEPSNGSKGILVAEIDFFKITYKEHIVKWLDACMKEAADNPILRETIKQYSLLIKKLTYMINKADENELFDLILTNYEESMFLSNNVNEAVGGFKKLIRQKIADKLSENIGDLYNILMGDNIGKAYSQIWLKVKGKDEGKLFFGIQSFAVTKDIFFNGLIIGVFILNGKKNPEYAELGEYKSDCWMAVQEFSKYNEIEADLSNAETIQSLYSSKEDLEGFVNHIVKESLEYLNEKYEMVSSLLE